MAHISADNESAHSCLLPAVEQGSKALASGWLKLAMASLLGSGVFSILLVLARTPVIKDAFPWDDFFYTGMVVHVNLSVLMFFLPCAGIIWSFNSGNRHILLGRTALYIAAIGTAIMVASAFMADGKPLMSNYIPVIEGPVFFVGLSLIGVGFSLLVVRSLIASTSLGLWSDGASGLQIGIYAAACSGAVAIFAIIWSYITIPDSISGQYYYEVLFWGGGHILQYIHTLLMLVCWLWLASACRMHISLTPRMTAFIFIFGVSTILFVPYILIMQNVESVESISNFTQLMRVGGGMAALPFALVIIWSSIFYVSPEPSRSPLRTTLIYSMLLFAVGGIFGYMIEGSNTMITAHYHGSNGAITLAYMGLIYLLLYKLGFAEPKRKLANWQAHAFGMGQLLHAIGLAWAGGYGMQRKVAGSGQALDNFQQTAGMAVMGIGGLIAVIGGVLFLVVVISAMRNPNIPAAGKVEQ